MLVADAPKEISATRVQPCRRPRLSALRAHRDEEAGGGDGETDTERLSGLREEQVDARLAAARAAATHILKTRNKQKHTDKRRNSILQQRHKRSLRDWTAGRGAERETRAGHRPRGKGRPDADSRTRLASQRMREEHRVWTSGLELDMNTRTQHSPPRPPRGRDQRHAATACDILASTCQIQTRAGRTRHPRCTTTGFS